MLIFIFERFTDLRLNINVQKAAHWNFILEPSLPRIVKTIMVKFSLPAVQSTVATAAVLISTRMRLEVITRARTSATGIAAESA